MAKYLTSTQEALSRWRNPGRLSVDTEMTQDGGVYAARLDVRTDTAEIDMVVTNVKVVRGVRSGPAEAQEVFTRFIEAPNDAALLAAEVDRLTAALQRARAEIASRSGEQPPVHATPGNRDWAGGTRTKEGWSERAG